jgi:hypothetical protein
MPQRLRLCAREANVQGSRSRFGISIVLAAAAFACGSTPDASSVERPLVESGVPIDSPVDSASVTAWASAFGDASLLPADFDSGSDSSGCATDTVTAQATPLDLYFMIDTSGSMNDLVGPRQSKWNAVTLALTTFVGDPASTGLGVGAQSFPATAAGVSASCTSSPDCGPAGPCLLGLCNDGSDDACATDADCARHASCDPVGACEYDPNALCPVPGGACGPDNDGFDLGICVALRASSCANGDSCSAADYARPSVELAPLPGAAVNFNAWLRALQPHGSTPTPAALQGAVDGAEAYATAHPGETVVAVLVTDGTPDEVADPLTGQCTPIDSADANVEVAQIARDALAGDPSVKTFAIGVFAPEEIASATASLDAIASAGGTTAPFVVDTQNSTGGPSVEQQFVDALRQIRSASLPCQFILPSPSGGSADYDAVNVRFTSSTGTVMSIVYVEGPANCDAADGGWYYDMDPARGYTPTFVEMCPATCETLKGDPAGRVDVVLGCQTLIR